MKQNRDCPKRAKKKPAILVVDDDETIRELFKRLLKEEGYVVDVAEDGNRAIEMAKERVYNIAFIDIVMPGLNGHLTLLELKKINPNIKAVMVTGYSVESVVKEALEAAAVTCIYKPFSREIVFDIVSQIF